MTFDNTGAARAPDLPSALNLSHALQESAAIPILAMREAGGSLTLDPADLIGQHTLIQAMSGGGKSFALRRLLELCLGAGTPVHIFDVENEFGTLKEAFPDIAIVGGDGADVPLALDHVHSMALTLLEARASAIIQLGELSPDDQSTFVARFLDALMQAPARMWHPLIVALDEAQRFAPQARGGGSGEAVATLMRQGRKRGFSAVLATQRFSAVSKACLTQASNFLIGRVTSETDIRRAEAELGLDRSQAQVLRNLSAGSFLVRGPALAPESVQVKITPTLTRHGQNVSMAMASSSPRVPFDVVLARLNGLAASAPERSAQVAGVIFRQPGMTRSPRAPFANESGAAKSSTGLSPEAQQMLMVLAATTGRGLAEETVGILIGRGVRGDRFTRALGELLARGLVRRGRRRLGLTALGTTSARELPAIPTLAELIAKLRMPLGPEQPRCS